MKVKGYFFDRIEIYTLVLFFSLGLTFLNPFTVTAQNHGDVVRAQGGTTTYLILNGQRRAFATEDIFRQMGYRSDQIKEVDPQALAAIPEGPPLWSKENVGAIPDGTLIRLRGTAYTYVIQGGRKCYIPDPETFQSKGYQWDQVQEVDRATLDSIVTGIPVASAKPPYQYTPPGKVPGAPSAGAPAAYPSAYPSTTPPGTPSYPTPSTGYPSTSSPTSTYPSSSPSTPSYPSPSSPSSSYPSSGYPSSSPSPSYPSTGSYPSSSPSSSYPSSSPSSGYPSSSYPSASSIFPNGTIVKGSGPDTYIIQDGVKRLIPDLQTFKNFGFDQSKITTIDDMKLKSMPLGVPLPKK